MSKTVMLTTDLLLCLRITKDKVVEGPSGRSWWWLMKNSPSETEDTPSLVLVFVSLFNSLLK